MTVQWHPDILNKFLAPGLASFDKAEIPDLRPDFPQWTYWVANHFLNNVLRSRFKSPLRQYAMNFMYRTQATFRFYHEARDATHAYLTKGRPDSPSIGHYCKALATWESTFLNWAICLDLIKRLNSNQNVFVKNDGSREERAYSLHITIKHHAEDIRALTLTGDDTLPFWMTSKGVRSKIHELSYGELAELVRDVAKLAEELQDARGFVNKP